MTIFTPIKKILSTLSFKIGLGFFLLIVHTGSASEVTKKVDVMIVRKGEDALWKSQRCGDSACDFEFGKIKVSIIVGEQIYMTVLTQGKDDYCCLFSNGSTTAKRFNMNKPVREDLYRFTPTTNGLRFYNYFGQIFVKVAE
ncbi:hypothetical protein FHX08_005354 [Rhizobium sp. BK529]|uniref:hypothetical protein n=1 Tax=Rhizobium sp. BK529 TaxID=2586983 RepID=UPI0016152588|nr:hypothetical protein [Rhizobium sp. BK529]MBB3594944.1 hypothetical protein [Rhizobium sp. BK529]